MTTISSSLNREQVAAVVVGKLQQHGINAVLVGGSVVSIYTDNQYASFDLDFISPADHKKIAAAMSELGFSAKGKDFMHPESQFTVEFPTGPVAIGDEVPVVAEGKIKVDGVEIVLLSPTQSVMDRLASFFHHNDRQCLDQAVWVAQRHPVDMSRVTQWAAKEGQDAKFKVFLDRL